MNLLLLLQLALTFAPLSLVAVGGAAAVLPDIHRQVVEARGWMSDGAFLDLFAVAQAAPGPNVMVVSLIGWQVAGVPGFLVATVANDSDRAVSASIGSAYGAKTVTIAAGASASASFSTRLATIPAAAVDVVATADGATDAVTQAVVDPKTCG